MSGINQAIIVGRMGQEPEVRYAANGNAVANLSIATSKKYKGEEETEWHRVVCFGKLAEVVQQYVHKGDLIGIRGEIRTRKWQDNTGHDRYSTEIIAHNMDMLGSKSRSDSQDNTDHRPKPADNHHPDKGHGHAPDKGMDRNGQSTAADPLDDGFDDIPF
jgi:single-strand DNA-binding protein